MRDGLQPAVGLGRGEEGRVYDSFSSKGEIFNAGEYGSRSGLRRVSQW